MSQLEQALQRFAAVVSILTAENTGEVMDISQQAAADVVSIFEDILQEMEVVGWIELKFNKEEKDVTT